MIKFSRNFIITLLCLICITPAFSQLEEYIELKIDNLTIGENVDPQVATTIMESITKTINDYNKFGKLIDPETGTFSFEISETFQGLFSNNAGVFNDLSQFQEILNIRDYVTEVYEYLPDEGVNFLIPEMGAELLSISYDEAGFFTGVVNVQKIMYIGLAEDKSRIDFPEGKTLDLVFTFDIPEKSLNDARIYEIKGQAPKKRARAKTRLSFAGRYGFGLLVGGSSTTFASEFGDSPVSYSNPMDVSLDFLFKRTIGRSGKLYGVIGAYGGFSQVNTNIDGTMSYTYAGGVAPLTSEINVAFQQGAKDITTYYYAGLPLGISYYLKDNFKSDIFLDVLLLPAFILSSSGEYQGDIDFSETLLGLDIADGSNASCGFGGFAFGGGSDSISSADPAYSPDFSGYSLGLRVAPVYNMEIGYAWGLEVGLDVSYYFVTGFNTADDGNIFAEDYYLNNDISQSVQVELDNSSLFTTLNKSLTNLQVGARIGVYYRFD